MGAQGSAFPVTLLGGTFVCAHDGVAIRRMANTSFFISFSQRKCTDRPLFNRNAQRKSINLIVSSRKRFSSLVCRIFNPKFVLTNKFARRLVIRKPVLNVMANHYVRHKRWSARRFCLAKKASEHGRAPMKKTILTILGSALIAASMGHAASATEHRAIHKAHRAPVAANFRNSNAYVAPSVSVQPDWSRYDYGAESAPAGH
jgi:hypothetical protein